MRVASRTEKKQVYQIELISEQQLGLIAYISGQHFSVFFLKIFFFGLGIECLFLHFSLRLEYFLNLSPCVYTVCQTTNCTPRIQLSKSKPVAKQLTTSTASILHLAFFFSQLMNQMTAHPKPLIFATCKSIQIHNIQSTPLILVNQKMLSLKLIDLMRRSFIIVSYRNVVVNRGSAILSYSRYALLGSEHTHCTPIVFRTLSY